MTPEQAMNTLLMHGDPDVRAATTIIKAQVDRRKRVIELVQEALAQLRLDIKYLVFDLECTRRERDEAKGTI